MFIHICCLVSKPNIDIISNHETFLERKFNLGFDNDNTTLTNVLALKDP